MDKIEIIHINNADFLNYKEKTCLILGNFDGIHLGHQKLFEEAVRIIGNSEARCAVMTFTPHPKSILTATDEYNQLLTPWEIKKELLSSFGIKTIFIVEFTNEFAKVAPETFIETYVKGVQASIVIVGEDFRYGAFGKGDAHSIFDYGEYGGYQAFIIPPVVYHNKKISSSMIRQLLNEGNVKLVEYLLNRKYQIRGNVIHGEKRGRQLGFPTANLALTDPYVLPKNGVYAVEVLYVGERYYGVMNIGTKPTFHNYNKNISIEVHLLDFNGDLYDQQLSIYLIDYIRPEKRFESLDALKQQIIDDINTLKMKNFS